MSKEVNVTLTEDEAWVLFDLTRRFSDSDKLNIEDQAEERALWNLCCVFEKTCIKNLKLNTKSLLHSAEIDFEMKRSTKNLTNQGIGTGKSKSVT